jgi:hypothetical protein
MTELLARTVGSGIAISTDLGPICGRLIDATQPELAVISLQSMLAMRCRLAASSASASTGCPLGGGATDSRGFCRSQNFRYWTGDAARMVARAFEPFFNQEAGKAAGLGLAWCTTPGDGRFGVDPQRVSRGTAVTLLLPTVSRREPTEPARRTCPKTF